LIPDAICQNHCAEVLGTLKAIDRRPMKNGKLIEDDSTAIAFLVENMQPILQEYVPIWRRLGVLPS
jgi:hypothetical protein